MKSVKIGTLYLDPVRNPAILDTATWDIPAAIRLFKQMDATEWASLRASLADGRPGGIVQKRGAAFYLSSTMSFEGGICLLATLPDSQRAILHIYAPGAGEALDGSHSVFRDDSMSVSLYAAEYETLHTLIRRLNPLKGPRALGSVPRIGIGSRNSTLAWPAVYRSMKSGGFAANSIQNSMREIGTLQEVSTNEAVDRSYLYGFGEVPPAYTGATFEGVWTYGVLEALSSDFLPIFGADADHLQLKSDVRSVERMKKILNAARHYSFFTMDISQIADYQAMFRTSLSGAAELLDRHIPQDALRKDVLMWHRQRYWFNGREYRFDEALLGRLVGKYWEALSLLEKYFHLIRDMKQGEPFDFELTIDEVPPGIHTHEIITGEEELLFLLNEAERRGLSLTHVAPNFGIEKTTDYCGPDGLEGLFRRVSNLHAIAEQYGLMLDCHSGDDLSDETRHVFGRATGGRIHYKISPSIGDVFAETLFDYDRERFMVWWNDTMEFARKCAAEGSGLATALLASRDRRGNGTPNPKDFLFKEFKFTMPGRKDSTGQMDGREFFYDLPEDFKNEYSARVEKWILQVSRSLFDYQ
ncbi:hypothetical protein SPIRO4BDMA_50053 [uncultured spirochete]|uniref:Uncharacterized protein n=1 Tax=uncultured spirochete TaxID=156406 RepID=A0A3P3XQH0_9SPIR|nr:hypothetical protein SPIRO4BDMA_50053 [uncultured spirochete]